MRNYIALLSITFLLLTNVSFAQNETATLNDPAAEELLKEISIKYKKYATAKMDLSLIIDLPEVKEDEIIDVKAWLKGDMFKIELPDQLFISDNKTLWNYMKEYNEVQINHFEDSDALFSPSVIFDLYNDKYVYRVKEEYNKDGAAYKVIELSPKDKEEQFFKIDLMIKTSDKTIVQSKIYEKSGIHYVYKINSFTPNVELTQNFFMFNADKYPGIYVEDFR